MMKRYICECGREFDNSQTFNGHKQGCHVHIEAKYGSWEDYLEIKNRNHDKGSATYAAANKKRKEEELAAWIAEKHTCEKCGRVMTEKFGSGRFCSRSCANSNEHPDEIKKKISDSVKSSYSDRHIREKNITKYLLSPNKCFVCGTDLPYNKRNHKTCCKDCKNIAQGRTMTRVLEKSGLHRTAIKTYKYGNYKGIPCDSSWELAFVLYNLDHGINVERNTKYFRYNYQGAEHNYFPDFIISGEYFEIKNFITDQVIEKTNQFPADLKLTVIDKEGIKPYLKYAKNTYGEDFCNLYDDDGRAWFSNKK